MVELPAWTVVVLGLGLLIFAVAQVLKIARASEQKLSALWVLFLFLVGAVGIMLAVRGFGVVVPFLTGS